MKHILIPTDFSAHAEQAAIFGVGVALSQEATITFFHLDSFVGSVSAAPTGDYKAEIQAHVAESTTKLQHFAKKVYGLMGVAEGKIPTNYVVVEGIAFADQASVYAKKHHIDLIVLGTKGQTGLATAIFGSNASSLISKAHCPVLAIPAKCKYEHINYIAFATTLENTEKAVAGVIDFVRLFKCSLQLFYIYPCFPANINLDTFDNHALVADLRKKFDYEKIRLYFQHTSKENDVQGGINEFLRVYKPSMLALYTHERTWLEKILNASVTESIALQIELPLLALKE